jgi:UDP-N-acetylglucosamine--N-acetylmuramyl-(pentapeptide) pyrophosphoryl-undecaprenol N-acetylglucosamine transferase
MSAVDEREDKGDAGNTQGDGEVRSWYFFAGGGTGGHIYPAIAIAEQIRLTEPEAGILFFCSERSIDSQVLTGSGFEFVRLPGSGFSIRPDKAFSFVKALVRGYETAKKKIRSLVDPGDGTGRASSVMVGIGGFASVAGVLAAGRVGVPVAMVNVDIVPGRANRFLGRFAEKIFVQFPDTAEHFGKMAEKVIVSGCPLRAGFGDCNGWWVIEELGLDAEKKTLVVTGASSGSANINRALTKVLGEPGAVAEAWQIVHLTGSVANTRRQLAECGECGIAYHPVDYFEDMAGLYAIADLVVGRSGAVSVAEYAASGTPAICLPYPWHKDRHQYLNAQKLVDAGAAVIVEDKAEDIEATAAELDRVLKELTADENRRAKMSEAARGFGNVAAGRDIAERLRYLRQ